MEENVKQSKIEEGKVFLAEAHAELKKVTWPSREQTFKGTWVVIIGVIILAVLLGLVDFGLSSLVKYILK